MSDKYAALLQAAEKATPEEWVKDSGEGWEAICCTNDQGNGGFVISTFEGPDATANREFVQLANPATILALLAEREADKELIGLQRDKIKRLESDLWDEQQLRKVHSQKSFELENENRDLKRRNDKDFIWRGEEICRLNDELDALKEKCVSAGITFEKGE